MNTNTLKCATSTTAYRRFAVTILVPLLTLGVAAPTHPRHRNCGGVDPHRHVLRRGI